MSFRELTRSRFENDPPLQAGQIARQVARAGVVDWKTATRYFGVAEAAGVGRETELSDAVVADVARRVQDRPEAPLLEEGARNARLAHRGMPC